MAKIHKKSDVPLKKNSLSSLYLTYCNTEIHQLILNPSFYYGNPFLCLRNPLEDKRLSITTQINFGDHPTPMEFYGLILNFFILSCDTSPYRNRPYPLSWQGQGRTRLR